MLGLQAASSDAVGNPLHLVEEINHRVVNEYAEAISDLSLAAARSEEGASRQALKLAAERLRAHAAAHRALLPPIDGHVNLADYVGQLCATFSRSALAERQVNLFVDTDEVWMASDRAWRFALAVAELIRNAARHGLRGRTGTIAVQISQRGDEVVCKVLDDGRCAQPATAGRGVGLVRSLAEDLGGSADWRFTEGGCLAQLYAPVER